MTEDQTSTGRLFRAASVDDEVHTDAIPALPSERARVEDVLPDEAFRAEVPVAAVAVSAGSAGGVVLLEEVTPQVSADTSAPAPVVDGGLSARWVWIIIVGVTVLMAIADILIRKQGIGWVTGVGLLAATLYCATASQRTAMWWSAIVPPLAVALTIVTVGQATLTRSNSLVISQGLNLLDSLGRTAPFIVASVIAAVITCFVRRNRARKN